MEVRNPIRKGFTIVEVVVAVAILFIIIIATMQVLAFSYSSLMHQYNLKVAKDIASYTVEYLRARTVTSDNTLGYDVADFGDSDVNKIGHYLPGMLDLWDIPVQASGHPDGGVNQYLDSINDNPAMPSDTFHDNPDAFYYSLQGYVSLQDFDTMQTTQPNPCKEDPNLYICNYSSYVSGAPNHYHCMNVYQHNGGYRTNNHIIVRFPLTTDSPHAVKLFSALPGYLNMVYTTNSSYTNPDSPDFNPFYTNDAKLKARTQAYRGFRVLLTVVARKTRSAQTHVKYYDVKVVVYWMEGKTERYYPLETQIAVYGGK